MAGRFNPQAGGQSCRLFFRTTWGGLAISVEDHERLAVALETEGEKVH